MLLNLFIVLLSIMSFLMVIGIINIKVYKKKVNEEIQLLIRDIENIDLDNYNSDFLDDDYEYLTELNITVKELIGKIHCMLKEAENSKKLYIEANDKLKELDETKTNFLSTISHEFRVPLTSIMGFSKIMKKKFNKIVIPEIEKAMKENSSYNFSKLELEVKKSIENIDIVISESERLTSMINNILDIAKIEAGAVQWNMEEVDMSEIINKAILTTYSILEDKDIELIDSIPDNTPKIYCDKDKILQVIINLLSNAVKFTEQGNIICEVRKEDKNLRISVEDTGIGIEKEHLKDIFERFKQVGDALKDKPKGSGLGLAISKAIIEQHGGEIWAESTLGLGSKFIFTLPLNLEVKNEKDFSCR